MRNIFDLTVKENREYRRKHLRVWGFAYSYWCWRSAYNLSREEALEELEGIVSSENALLIAEKVDQLLASNA